MICLCNDKEAIASMVYRPFTDELFYAARGKGAFRNGKKITCPESSNLQSGYIEANRYSDAKYDSQDVATLVTALRHQIQVYTRPPASSYALEMCSERSLIRAVIHDNIPTKVKQESWDILPIQLLIEEAGGVVCTLNGENYDFASPSPLIMAQNITVAEEILLSKQS